MNTKPTKKEILAKITISTVLLMSMFLSFFFAKKLENLFGMNLNYAKNEVSKLELGDSSYYVDYLDVGQGNCTFVKFPDGKTLLVDGGNTMYGQDIANYLTDRGVSVIDHMIATHSDSDHIGGLNYILDNFEVKNIYRPFQIAGSGDNAETFVANEYEDLAGVYYHYANLSSKNKISRVTSSIYNEFIENIYTETYTKPETNLVITSKITVFYDGLKISGENYEIEFFAPLLRDNSVSLPTMSGTYGYATKGYGVSKSNDNSAIFLLTICDDKFLFTGDASCGNSSTENSDSDKFEELDFLDSLNLEDKLKLKNISVYLAGHHGSSYSSSSNLFQLINPKFLVISVGAGNSYGHPSSEVIFRAEKTTNLEKDYLLRTDTMGLISFGNHNNKLVYSLEISTTKSQQKLSWQLFAFIVCVTLITIIIFIKPIKIKHKNSLT